MWRPWSITSNRKEMVIRVDLNLTLGAISSFMIEKVIRVTKTYFDAWTFQIMCYQHKNDPVVHRVKSWGLDQPSF